MRRRTALLALLVWAVAAPVLLAQGATTTFTHDANGNLTSKTEGGVVWTYLYDSRDLLREVQRDGTLFETYQYDAQGRRIRKTSAEGIVRYAWDENRILQETDDFGNTIATYTYAGDRLLSRHHVTEGTVFYLPDALGSPTALMTADGAVAARYQYDAWGNVRSESGSSSNPVGFTGHRRDEGTGLYQANARYYDPAVGRFITEDPAQGDPAVPPSLHRYLYAHANPTVYVDPSGKYAEGGHYYSVYYAAMQVGFTPQQAQQLAFYAQLPDETTEMDAIALQSRAAYTQRTPASREARDRGQRQVHALTGGRSADETAATTGAVRAAGDDLATIGLLLHRLGDSFAHRQLGNEEQMYPTGGGHGLDSIRGDDPDAALQRPGLYLRYMDTLVRTLAEQRGFTPEQVEQAIRTSNPLQSRGGTFLALVNSGEDPDTLVGAEGLARGVALEYLVAIGQVTMAPGGQLDFSAGSQISNCLASSKCQEEALQHRMKTLLAQGGGNLSYQPEEHDLNPPISAFVDTPVTQAIEDYRREAGRDAPRPTPAEAAAARQRAGALLNPARPHPPADRQPNGVVQEGPGLGVVVVPTPPPNRNPSP